MSSPVLPASTNDTGGETFGEREIAPLLAKRWATRSGSTLRFPNETLFALLLIVAMGLVSMAETAVISTQEDCHQQE